MRMPHLETERLKIRQFTLDDLAAAYGILDVELGVGEMGDEGAQTLEGRQAWLEWTVRNYEELAKLHQPPYGERAITLKSTGELIGAAGFVPCLNVFGQLPYFQARRVKADRYWTEFGMFWAISTAHQRRGYATEAARAMIDYAFTQLRLGRVIATTTYNNEASIGVMRRLGMRIEKNPYSNPPWLQVVGFLEPQEVK